MSRTRKKNTFTRREFADELISAMDVAEILGVSRQTLSNWARRGVKLPELTRIANGTTPVYLRSDVEAWAADNVVESTQVVVRRLKAGAS